MEWQKPILNKLIKQIHHTLILPVKNKQQFLTCMHIYIYIFVSQL